MALFRYQAFSKDGKKVRNTLDAPTLEAARDQITKMGLYPVNIELATYEGSQTLWGTITSFFAPRISIKEKILFTKQLAVLLKSGIPLLQALELLIEQFEGRLRSIIVTLRDNIKEGQSLAEGLARYPKVFDTIYIQLVRAGEATGKLEIILERLVDYLERRQAITKRVKAALRYPMIQLSIIVLVVIALLTLVLPTLAKNFASQKQELPWTTSFLLGVSDVLINYWYLLLGGFILIIVLFRYWRSTPSGALILDKLKLKLPIVSFFARMSAVVQFSRTLGILVESGVNLAESLDIVVKIIDNKVLSQALSDARDNIVKQGRIAEFLKETGIFPPIAIYLINTGEQSGQLDAMLLTVAQNYETDLMEYSDNLSSLIEPIMLVVMGVVVGFVVLSVVQPMLQQAQFGA
ncbi:MAG: type II secretion system F family protein [Candidatus Babeliales bacterium]